MGAPDAAAAPADDSFRGSRRLTGANRWFAGPGVVLEALGPAAGDAAAQDAWAARVHSACAVLGWPDPQPRVHAAAGEVLLAFAAPPGVLYTATEVNEWAWARSAGAPAQPDSDEPAELAVWFGARAAAERSPPLERLRAAAAAHGLPLLEDDDTVSVGSGCGSRSWPRAALPLPLDVPWDRLHTVPTVLVTGSNGKTTTTRLLAAIAEAAGLVAGCCTTEGVHVGGTELDTGDYAGPVGARTVLRHPAVQFAALETARGGLLRRGLAAPQASAAVVTRIAEDHLGEYGVHGLHDIAETKLAVAHALHPGGTLVLGADDALLLHAAAAAPQVQGLHQAWFAADHALPALAAARARGWATCGVRDGELVLSAPDGLEHELGAVATMPLTLGGAAAHNVLNLAAAALAAHAAGLPLAAVHTALGRFGQRPQDNPGRLERWPWRGATVLVDYAHNPDAMTLLLQVARSMQPARLALLLGQAGNRDDGAIGALCRVAAAAAPARIVIKELPAMWRGREAGEVPALIEAALRGAGVAPERLLRVDDEEAAAQELLDWARPGDVIVLPLHTHDVRERVVAQLAAGAA